MPHIFFTFKKSLPMQKTRLSVKGNIRKFIIKFYFLTTLMEASMKMLFWDFS